MVSQKLDLLFHTNPATKCASPSSPTAYLLLAPFLLVSIKPTCTCTWLACSSQTLASTVVAALRRALLCKSFRPPRADAWLVHLGQPDSSPSSVACYYWFFFCLCVIFFYLFLFVVCELWSP
jgi:hypothetical protein